MARGELEGSTVDELVYLSCNLLNRPYPDYNTVNKKLKIILLILNNLEILIKKEKKY